MVDSTQVSAQAEAAVTLVKSEVPFVKANWTKLSAVVIAVFVVGVVVGHIL